MAAVARKRLSEYPSARVDVSKFEDWDSKGASFDLVFASASWHWLQPDVRYAKAASVLRFGGHIATAHSEHFFPKNFDPLFLPIQEAYRDVTGSGREIVARDVPTPGQLDSKDDEHVAEMNRVGDLELTDVTRFLWHIDRTADQYIDLLATYSDHWALEHAARCLLFDSIHGIIADGPTGSIRKHYLTTLRTSRRIQSIQQ
jgi:SAM-dependent methyltransferase